MSRWLAPALLALCLAPVPARAQLALEGDAVRASFSPAGELVRLETCSPSCAAPQVRQTFAASADAPLVSLQVAGDAAETRRIAGLTYVAQRRDDPHERVVALVLVSEPLAEGVVLRKTWQVARHGYESTLDVALEGPGADAYASAHRLELAIAPGAEQRTVEVGDWRGVRGRFFGLLARPAAHLEPARVHGFQIYSGPIERGLLRATDPALEGLLFAHLWFWMRWLTLGMTILLGALLALVHDAGVAVLLLSPCVKVLMRPLSALAERWQRDVNELKTKLQPGIEAIKASAHGAERSERLLALHREHGVTPFYGLKSLLSVAIQIPIFFAAYHALDESFALAGVPFLWIADLAEPDRFASFPHPLPFFGASLNLLPFVMSAVTLISSRLHDDGALAPELLRRQRLGLYGLALAFFLLFYSVPAGMVLYWTSNNLVALVWQGIARRMPGWRDRTLEARA